MSDSLEGLIGECQYRARGPIGRKLSTVFNLVRWAALATSIGFGWQFGQNLGQIVTYLAFR